MSLLEALILGIIQGLTEFLPVSSSGHLELGKYLLNIDAKESFAFTLVVHGATVLSTMVVFRKDLLIILLDLLKFEWNSSTQYVAKLLISMIPVVIVGLLWANELRSMFTGNIVLVGSMLLITALLLTLSNYKQSGKRPITYLDSLIIGIAQAFAVLPGISRSGATISTGLIIGNSKDLIARFSFLMVLLPILAANTKDLLDGNLSNEASVGVSALITGFVAAFISGLLACKWMINLVKRGKLIYFAVYCFLLGITAITIGMLS